MKTIKAHCNRCSRQTLHHVLHEKRQREEYEDDEGESFSYSAEDYQTIECCGCAEIKLMVTSFGSEFDTYVTYHPGAMARTKPSWASDLYLNGVLDPLLDNINELLREIYTGLQNRMPRLVAMGVRGLIEAVMIHQKANLGGFEQNVEALHKAGHLSEKDSKRLLKVIDAGSAVIHRGHKPTEAEVIAMVAVVEHLLMSIYVNDGLADTASQRVPPRPPRPPRLPNAHPPEN